MILWRPGAAHFCVHFITVLWIFKCWTDSSWKLLPQPPENGSLHSGAGVCLFEHFRLEALDWNVICPSHISCGPLIADVLAALSAQYATKCYPCVGTHDLNAMIPDMRIMMCRKSAGFLDSRCPLAPNSTSKWVTYSLCGKNQIAAKLSRDPVLSVTKGASYNTGHPIDK